METWLLAGLAAGLMACRGAEPAGVDWHPFDSSLLATARQEKKLVFIDVEAVWCHWCHVMDVKTYSDPAVQEALRTGFLCAKVDQDSRPDLARRYEEYGWPALVIFDPVTLQDRVIGSGFHEPSEFFKLLERGKSGTGEPTAPATAATAGALSDEQRTALQAKLHKRFDTEQKGWGSGHKFVPWQNIEECISAERAGDSAAAVMARDTLDAGTALIDPVWGGLYQYSTNGDWKHPHFEKIMEFQAEVTRIYALAYLAWGRPADLQAAEAIANHLETFLCSPEGPFYVSQDADVVPGQHSADYFAGNDADRRKNGVPKVDRHLYTRENGFAITALVTLWQASGKGSYLEEAKRAADWIIAHRGIEGGGFSHDEKDEQGPFLADQVQMGRALLGLHGATGDPKWLDRSVACAAFVNVRFRRDEARGAGFFAGITHPDQPSPVVDRDENIALARWCNQIARYTGGKAPAAMSLHAMRFLATDAVLDDVYSFGGGILLADQELATEPVHISIVGAREDSSARALFAAAQKYPSSYTVIEWITPGTAVPEGGITYPALNQAAAYLCNEGRCSLPITEPGKLADRFKKR